MGKVRKPIKQPVKVSKVRGTGPISAKPAAKFTRRITVTNSRAVDSAPMSGTKMFNPSSKTPKIKPAGQNVSGSKGIDLVLNVA